MRGAEGAGSARELRIHDSAGPLPPLMRRRPLVVLDVDEVVLDFLGGLEAWIAPQRLHLARDSFALNGNLRRADGTPVDVATLRDLLHEFFGDAAGDLSPLPGALDGIAALGEIAEILFLSNVPGAAAAARRRNLDAHGLAHPLIVNAGPKGPALARIRAEIAAPVIFLDDSPTNIASVVETAPEVHVVHFIADDRFRAMLDPHPGIGLLTGDWNAAASHIIGHIATAQKDRT